MELTGVQLLRQVQTTLAAAPENVQKQTLAKLSEEVPALWDHPLTLAASTPLQKRVILPGVAHELTPTRVLLTAANTLTPLSGGLVPGTQWHGAEFGATRRKIDVKFKGKTRRQLIGANFPVRRSDGYAAFQVARRNGPRIVAAYVHGAVKGLTMGNPNLETS